MSVEVESLTPTSPLETETVRFHRLSAFASIVSSACISRPPSYRHIIATPFGFPPRQTTRFPPTQPSTSRLVYPRHKRTAPAVPAMQAYTAGIVKPKATEILAPPPRSGSFSIYAQKQTALAFVWLCAIVVWGNITNFAVSKECNAKCGVQIGFAVIVWVYITILFLLNYLIERGTLTRTGCFSHAVEAQCTAFTILIWVPTVAVASTLNAAQPVAIWFSWFGFFGSIYSTYKAYHCFKEEDLPSDLPEGYDEEDCVFG